MTLAHSSRTAGAVTGDAARLSRDIIVNYLGRYIFLCENMSFGAVSQLDVAPQPGDLLGRPRGSMGVSILRRDGDDEFVLVGQASRTVMNLNVIARDQHGRLPWRMTPEAVDLLLDQSWANAQSETIIIH